MIDFDPMIEITSKAGTDMICVKHRDDREPIEVPVQELLEVIAEKFPNKVLQIAEFMNDAVRPDTI